MLFECISVIKNTICKTKFFDGYSFFPYQCFFTSIRSSPQWNSEINLLWESHFIDTYFSQCWLHVSSTAGLLFFNLGLVRFRTCLAYKSLNSYTWNRFWASEFFQYQLSEDRKAWKFLQNLKFQLQSNRMEGPWGYIGSDFPSPTLFLKGIFTTTLAHVLKTIAKDNKRS